MPDADLERGAPARRRLGRAFLLHGSQGGHGAAVPAAPPGARAVADSAPAAVIPSPARDRGTLDYDSIRLRLEDGGHMTGAGGEDGGGRKTRRFRHLGTVGGIRKGPRAGGLAG